MTDVDLKQLAIDRGVPAQSGTRRRRHVLTRYVLPAVLIVGFLALVAWASRDIVFPPRDVTVVPVLATQAEVSREGTPLFKAAGWIEPRPTPVRVAALAPGVVARLLVVEDQPVVAGEAVAELIQDDAKLVHESALADSKLREAELEEAHAALAAARTRFEQPVHLEAALGEAEAALARVETRLDNLPFETLRAEARLEFVKKDYEGKLSAEGAVAGRAIDEARSAMESAAAMANELRGREESLRQEKTALIQRRDASAKQTELLADEIKARDAAEAQVKAARARVELAGVAVAEARLRLNRMTVRSPIDGRVYKLIGHPGASVGSSSGMALVQGYDGSTVVTLYRPDMLQVRVDVRFEDMPKVSVGQPVRIENPALSSPLTGRVLFTSSLADIQKNTLDVKVAIDNPPPVFKPEMLVDVTFLAPKVTDADTEPSEELRLYIPQSLVMQDERGSFVWLADQSAGVARKTFVETGPIGTGGLIQITRGLSISSRIITSETDSLEDEDRIKVVGESRVESQGSRTSTRLRMRRVVSLMPVLDLCTLTTRQAREPGLLLALVP